jgi:hypothetical protein
VQKFFTFDFLLLLSTISIVTSTTIIPMEVTALNSNLDRPNASLNECTPNPNLDKFIVHQESSRFKILKSCITVSGIVTLVHTPSDGDTVFALKLDDQYRNLVNQANYDDPNMDGGIWVELICQHKNTSKEPIHQGDCVGYDGPHFPTPKVGQYVEVSGRYQLDIREGGHAEIHPTYGIKTTG